MALHSRHLMSVIMTVFPVTVLTMRLDYFLAHSAGLTRKEAKQLISRGAVTVDGEPRPKANLQLQDGQGVWLHGEPVQLPGHRYLMLHKPPGVVCSTDDPEHRTVLDLLPAELRQDLHPAGRLDRDTTGLVLLTTDGQWSHRLTSPNHHCEKRYRVVCADPVSDEDLQALRNGILLRGEDSPTLPAGVERVDADQLLLTIREGRYHQVKRMLAARSNKVVALHREQIGEIALDADLSPGAFRLLTKEEIASI
jgi:16S rRNA pseudouridine516 synthase